LQFEKKRAMMKKKKIKSIKSPCHCNGKYGMDHTNVQKERNQNTRQTGEKG